MAIPDSTTRTVEIPLTQGQVAMVDADDADLAELKWHALFSPNYSGGGRYMAKRNAPDENGKGRTEYLHRVTLSRVLGRELTPRERVDHINGDTLDNRRSNLRLASHAENQRNRGKCADNSSGYKGVSWQEHAQRWKAKITVDGKQRHLGYFDSAEDAARAYDRAARELHGEFARLNFPS